MILAQGMEGCFLEPNSWFAGEDGVERAVVWLEAENQSPGAQEAHRSELVCEGDTRQFSCASHSASIGNSYELKEVIAVSQRKLQETTKI